MLSYRAIQDNVSQSESLAAVSDFAERLYWRMLSETDPYGRLPGRPAKIKALCVALLPVKEDKVERALQELEDVTRIRRYRAVKDGRVIEVCQLVDFDANQPSEFIRRRGKARFPEPPANNGDSRNPPESSGEVPSTPSLEVEVKGEVLNLGANAPVDEIYEHWRNERGKTSSRYAKISDARRRKIQSRLREFSADELKQCISAVALDPWEDRPRHDDLTVILRSREQVDKFLALAEDPPTRRVDPDEEADRRFAAIAAKEART